MNASDPVILYPRNRALAYGRKGRVRLNPYDLLSKTCWGGACLFFGFTFVYGLFAVNHGASRLLFVFYAVIGLFLLVAGLSLAGAVVHGFWKRAHLSRHGRLLTGTATKVEENRIYDGYGGSVPRVMICYRFLTPTGHEHTGEMTMLASPGRVSPGDHLAILYADEDIWQVL